MKIGESPCDFLGFQTPFEEAEFIIQPFPYEYTTTFGKGTGNGPEKVLEVSDYLEMYDEESGTEPYLRGIRTATPIELPEIKEEKDVEEAGRLFQKYFENKKKLLTIGGEHTITYPIFKEALKYYPKTGVLHLDAHGDLRDEYEGSRYNHACVMRRVADTGVKMVSAGIRAISAEEMQFINSNSDRIKLFLAHHIYDNTGWLEKALSFLPDEVYLTIDVDVFDSSVIRATGTPEPGGLSWYYILKLLKNIFLRKNVIAVDIVEICPDPPYEVSTYSVAKLIYKIISYWK